MTANEVNNLVYLGLRYSCGWTDVPNSVIEEAIRSLHGNSQTDVMIAVLAIALRHRRISRDEVEWRFGHLIYLTRAFFELPESIREDLGVDVAFFSPESLH